MLERAPSGKLKFPIDRPAGEPWEVRVVGIFGRYVLTWRRRLGERNLYPNQVIEKELGMPATTRGWDTFMKIAAILRG
ncbi:MAG: hypothetical protein M5R36_14865 [Deltaproteobacteria bacterium]|nr:hypothetical protein [Deltaproteobacteria bacterium]